MADTILTYIDPCSLRTCLYHWQGHESLKQIADTITVEEVNTIARSLLSYVSHYSAEDKAAAEAAANPEQWMDFGASRATSIVACVPAFMDASGKSAGTGSCFIAGLWQCSE